MKCEDCEGLGYKEYEHGLIRLPCRECNGTGEIPDDNDIDSRIGQPDSTSGSGDTSQPKQHKKSKAKKRITKRTRPILQTIG